MSRIFYAIFFLSGAAALLFETLWFRLVGLSLGNSIWSASLVLGAFMGGMALGNALTARLGNRISRPILLYVGLELVIGLVGALLVFALPEFPKLLGPMLGGLAAIPWLLNLVRLTMAFAVLVIPAIAMGATLPVLVHALTRVEPNFGASLGRLYGWNTLGAMLGAIASEALLIKWLGILGSGFFALVLNFAAALIALRLSRSFEADIAPNDALVTSPNLSARGYRYLGVAFLSGAIMLAFEVVGFRFLLLSHDGTSLIFAVMLGWLPSTGRGETVSLFGIQVSFLTWDGLRHLLLPALNLALFKMSLVIRLARAGTREVALQDYIKFARAKGLSSSRVVLVHVMKNIMIPVVTVLGLELGGVIAFAVVTETVFAWPGMGKLLIDSIQLLDRPVVVAYLMITVLMFIVINLVVDVIYSLLDPRVRLKDVKS